MSAVVRKFFSWNIQIFVFTVVVTIIFLFCSFNGRIYQEQSTMHVRIGEIWYVLEKADTEILRIKGLSHRQDMCDTCGMIFLFDTPGQYAFWMKDTAFSLDIAWLIDDTVVFVVHTTQPYTEMLICPPVLTNQVIELKAGTMNTLKIGDKVELSQE
ncbi:MAG: DUF192 domain-containing protein [Minisyncoccota bacterium]